MSVSTFTPFSSGQRPVTREQGGSAVRPRPGVSDAAGASLDTPVAIIVFNRPDLTRRLMAILARVRPRRLFVIADAPRPERPDDIAKTREVRAIVEAVDWDCRISLDYSEVNLGPGRRIFSGLTRVFDEVDRAIVVEDDCLPHPSFFRFCEELLERYADEPHVRTISGTNYLNGRARTTDSYHFSRFHHVWGFATWRRSWAKIDMSMSLWPLIRDEGWLYDVWGDRRIAEFWAPRFNNTFEGRINSWAYPYQFSCCLDGSLGITPNRNLVSNVGFGADASNTFFKADFAGSQVHEMPFPLRHPNFIVPDRLADEVTFRVRCLPERSALWRRLLRRAYYTVTGRPDVYTVRMGSGRLAELDSPG